MTAGRPGRNRTWGIEAKTVALAAALVVAVLLVTALPVLYLAAGSLEQQLGARALGIAQTFAASPALQEAYYAAEPIAQAAPMADQVRRDTGADFVIVVDRAGRRLSAPAPESLGKAVAELDFGPTLMEGRPAITRLQEARLPALAGLAPVHGRDGELVGLVSVGFRLEALTLLVRGFSLRVAATAALGLLIGAAGAVLLARQIKRQMFGLEPLQIAGLLEERSTILESVREGIIAIDAEEQVTVVNQEARRILGLAEDPVNRPVREVVPGSRLQEVLQSGEAQYDQEMILADRVVVTNRVPLRHEGQVVGVVASFRDRTELNRLTGELDAARRYSDGLRAQAHEFNNRLHAVAGLIQLGAVDEALEYVMRAQGRHQHVLDFVARAVPDPLVGAILLGKYNRAAELQVRLELDPASRFDRAPGFLGPDRVVAILGNLLDNAVEAVQALPDAQRWVRLTLDDSGPAVQIIVADGGPGVAPAQRELIFADGYSTRGGRGRGFGLALVRLLVTQSGGSIAVLAEPSRFVVTFAGRGLP